MVLFAQSVNGVVLESGYGRAHLDFVAFPRRDGTQIREHHGPELLPNSMARNQAGFSDGLPSTCTREAVSASRLRRIAGLL